MDVQAYGFSYTPPPLITTHELLEKLNEYHKDKKKWSGQFRLISYLNRLDKQGMYRGGILSVRDEKIALRLMEVDGEPTIAPSEIKGENVDFNCFLIKLDSKKPTRLLRGLFTSYFGSMSVRSWGFFIDFFAREVIIEKVTKILKANEESTSTRAINKYIEENDIQAVGKFSMIIIKSDFVHMVKKLALVRRIQLNYEVVSNSGGVNEPLSDIAEVIRDSRTVSFTEGITGANIAQRITDYIDSMSASSAKAIGVTKEGTPDEIDFYINPERFWKNDLDKIKSTMKISVENFTNSPIFKLLSEEFHDDPRLS